MTFRSLCVLGVLGSTTAWALPPSTPPPTPAQRVVRATPVEVSERESSVGSLSAARMLPLGFEVGGRLRASKVRKGDLVKAGQLLGSVDPEMIDIQISQAEAGLLAAEASAALASDVAGRQEKLMAEGSVSDVATRSAVTQAKQAQAQVLAAKAQLAQARLARRRHDLTAPFAATVVDAPDQVGGMVGPGTPVYVLMQLDTLVLKTTVPESARAHLRAGAKVRVESIGSDGLSEEASVRLVLPSADPQTRRLPVEILVPNADGRFVANTMARATFTVGGARKAYRIPATALGSTGGEHVFALSSDGVARRVSVAVAERGPKEVTVLSHENLGELVDYPTSALADGARVSRR